MPGSDVDWLLQQFIERAGHPITVTFGELSDALNECAFYAHVFLDNRTERECLRQGVIEHLKMMKVFGDPKGVVNAAWAEARWLEAPSHD